MLPHSPTDAEVARALISAALRDGPEQRIRPAIDRLRLAQRTVHTDPHAAARLLRDARGEIVAGLTELQAVARGIHPALLRDRGLDTALRDLAAGCAVPVTVRGAAGRRFSPAVELTAYLVVAQRLDTVAAAGAIGVTVRVEEGADAGLVVEIADMGTGGARVGRTGHVQVDARVRALGGTLVADHPCGTSATVLRVTLPDAAI
jgi:signal transduction histidine kinase